MKSKKNYSFMDLMILVKIYSFFNVCKIYEIEEELFIYGFDEIR